MDIEEMKREYCREMTELRAEAVQLIANIDEALAYLDEVVTEEDAETFSDRYEIERGLQHIELF